MSKNTFKTNIMNNNNNIMNNNNINNIDDIDDLLDIFDLKQNYTAADLDNKEKEYILNVVSSASNSQKKYELIAFINNTKKRLLENLNRIKQSDSIPGINPGTVSSRNSLENTIQIGDIINPRSEFPSMQFSNNAIKINGYTNKRIIRNYVFNTQYRDDYDRSYSTNCTFTLPQIMTNVISIDLSALQFPNYAYTFSRDLGTNRIYIREDTALDAPIVLVTIPDGNYNNFNFPPMLEKEINEQVVGSYIPGGPNRFQVSISDTTGRITISNTTYTFLFTQSYPDINNYFPCPTDFKQIFFPIGEQDKDILPDGWKFYSLAWLMGYREFAYYGKNSYTSESIFDNTFADYIYFTMDDYVGNRTSNTYGVIGTSLLENNILAVIPITAPQFSSTFDNNANFIYKTRIYMGPVNISKISIQLINEAGTLVNLHKSDFAFCLQVTSIYDPRPEASSSVLSDAIQKRTHGSHS
jgi:hypothetical protein